MAPLYYLRRELPKACGKLRRCKARPVILLDFRGQIPTSPFSFAFKILWSLFFPCRTHVPLDFQAKSPQVLSHLLLHGQGHPGMWLSLSVQSRKPTSPISSGFSDRYFSLATPMCHLDFPDQIVKSPQILSHVPLHGEGYPGAPLLSDKVCGKFRRCTAREVTLPPGALRYRQQQGDTRPSVLREPCRSPLQGDTRPSVLREPCRSPLQATTGRHAAVRSPRAVSLPVTGNNRETRGPFSASRVDSQ